jgi:hypothetical protein
LTHTEGSMVFYTSVSYTVASYRLESEVFFHDLA